MTVEPGYSGQPFLHDMLPKIKKLHQMLEHLGLDIEIGVDGGINLDTIQMVSRTQIDISIVGSGLFNAQDINRRYQELMNA